MCIRDRLGATPEMIEGIAGGTLIMNGGYKVLDHDEIVEDVYKRQAFEFSLGKKL